MSKRPSPSVARDAAREGRKGLAVLALVCVIAMLTACAGPRHRHMARHHGFESETGTIQVVTTLLGGKNVFIPSTIVVTSGAPHTLSIYNTTEIPHGFRIPALEIEAVLPSREEFQVELPALEGHQVLRIDCHLHPPHRTATLVVLPGKR